jgi:lipoprotein-anchoring transpeptidase ErfK/SrfK
MGVVVKRPWIGIVVGLMVVLLVVGLMFKAVKGRTSSAASSVSEAVAAPSTKTGSFDAAIAAAAALEAQGELLKARDAYKEILVKNVSDPGIETVQQRLESLNMKVMLSGLQVPDATVMREVKSGDSLSMIADEYRTTVAFIKRENGMTSDIIRPGQRLRIWTGRLSVLVDKSQNILMLRSNGELVRTYRVATGKDNITPVGTFKIINKLVRPDWTHDGKVVPYGDSENILGTRWMGFDIPSYGIHGTTKPETIGSQETAGCVRMLNSDVEELYDLLPVNTEVTITD